MTAPTGFSAARVCLCAVVLLLGSARAACPDEFVLRSGKVIRGHGRKEGREILVNLYGCSVPEMTLGVRRLREIDVRETRAVPLSDLLQRTLEELGPEDAARRLDLLRLAESGDEEDWALRLAAEVLVSNPTQPEALKLQGGVEKWNARRRADPRLDSALATEIRRLLRRESGVERRVEAARLAKRYGYDPGADVIERMARSIAAQRGLRSDIPLRLDAEAFEGGRYTLYVPETYDPLEPRPLLLALHGGGIMHEAGVSVRGSAKDALAHYLDGARALGWFLLCPDAIEAPWTTSRNAAFVNAVLEEVTTLWNVDLERVHLAGQGGGGDGAWFLANRQADQFASVAVAAAGKPTGTTSVASRTAIWLYHGEADEVVPVDPVRKAADALLRTKADFVYCELPREGHGLAPAARRDLFRFIAPKRRRHARDAWPLGSFSIPSTKDAIAAFGEPESAWGLRLPSDADGPALVAILSAGRMDAEHAARRLCEAYGGSPAEALAPAVRALVRDRERPAAARLWAAWLCGAWHDPDAINELGDTLRTSQDPRLLLYAARSVGQLGSPDSTQDLRWALADISRRFRAVEGKAVPFQALERACELGAAVAEAMGLCVTEPDEIFAELEECLVRHVLMDPRPIEFAAASGEDPARPRSLLVEHLAAAYRRLKAERTLYEMLRASVGDDPASLQALMRGLQTAPR